ncbi:MAG TPA: acyl-CoA dehydrogenase N-terminal domain-containing protein, partial [Pseudomonadota bacterium]|nr:acyl-CoA dehydrogenase N-terminal domain-containing protein [Pseudomonadota bacterium]
MAQGQNHYLADLREIQFVLFEQCGLGELLKSAPFVGTFDDSGVDMVLDEAYQFATTVVGPLNSAADVEGCRLVDGKVKTPAGFQDAWKRVYDSGLR